MFPARISLALAISSLFLSACNMTNRSYIKDTVARLPNGDQISGNVEVVQTFGKTVESRNSITWTRAGQDKPLTQLQQIGFFLPNHNEIQTHVTSDGNHVWLSHNGATCASFDYEQALAIIADKGHPSWAATTPSAPQP